MGHAKSQGPIFFVVWLAATVVWIDSLIQLTGAGDPTWIARGVVVAVLLFLLAGMEGLELAVQSVYSKDREGTDAERLRRRLAAPQLGGGEEDERFGRWLAAR